ncbi:MULTISPECIES: amidohydrolase family protein [unclassified Leucobacter]|uniref:amidohydrolase n=1 Tax=unclassified Leucobacter TaxID=2621730 RepID=UPI00165DF7C6|nr:amidohydrolase family protein [Leucobacter sp. cx-87]
MNFLLTGGVIHTQDATNRVVDTLAVVDGRIVFAGERDGFVAMRDAACAAPVLREINLGGRVVVPGFIDSHTHPEMVSKSAWHTRLPWTDDVTEILDFVRDYAAAHPREEMPFLYFEYYPSTLFGDGQPTKELLDAVVSDRPVLLQDFSEHASWVNSKALEYMGVNRDTPDPVPGLEMFVRDEQGEPTGHLLELVQLRFMDTMYRNLGWTPPEQMTPETLETFLSFLAKSGVTALFDAMLADEDVVKSLAELDRRGELNLHYEGALRFRSRADLPAAIARAQRLNAEYGGDRIRVNALKLFLDGTNETGNSAVLEPMCGGHSPADGAVDLGEIQMDVAELHACLELCNRERIDVHIHLVGDRAFRTACDAVALARASAAEAGESWDTQVTFAHCELVDPEDMHRPAELGIFINWTPHWSGGYFGEGAIAHLGEDRWSRMYQFNQMVDSGAMLTLASDVTTRYEMERAAPLFGMQVASTRVDPDYPLDGNRYPGSVRPAPEASLSRELLLAGYTTHGAKQLRIDHQAGSLEVGKLAHLAVLSDDLFAVEPGALGDIHCEAVVFEGRLISGTLPGW